MAYGSYENMIQIVIKPIMKIPRVRGKDMSLIPIEMSYITKIITVIGLKGCMIQLVKKFIRRILKVIYKDIKINSFLFGRTKYYSYIWIEVNHHKINQAMYTTQKQVRESFWNFLKEINPELAKEKRTNKSQNDYKTDIRVSFVQYVDDLNKDGQIKNSLATKVTL